MYNRRNFFKFKKIKRNKNNITVRKVNSKIKKEIFNLSKNKTSKKNEKFKLFKT